MYTCIQPRSRVDTSLYHLGTTQNGGIAKLEPTSADLSYSNLLSQTRATWQLTVWIDMLARDVIMRSNSKEQCRSACKGLYDSHTQEKKATYTLTQLNTYSRSSEHLGAPSINDGRLEAVRPFGIEEDLEVTEMLCTRSQQSLPRTNFFKSRIGGSTGRLG